MRRSSTPMSAPTITPSAKARTAGRRKCPRCATARPWPGVCGYVTQVKTDSYGTPTARYATTRQRKALATMGRRAPKRWETNPEGEYAQGRRQVLKQTHRRTRAKGQTTRARIQASIGQFVETGLIPTRKENASEMGVHPTNCYQSFWRHCGKWTYFPSSKKKGVEVR